MELIALFVVLLVECLVILPDFCFLCNLMIYLAYLICGLQNKFHSVFLLLMGYAFSEPSLCFLFPELATCLFNCIQHSDVCVWQYGQVLYSEPEELICALLELVEKSASSE